MNLLRKIRIHAVVAVILSTVVLLGSVVLPSERAYADAFIDEVDGAYQKLLDQYTKQYEEDKVEISEEYSWLHAILTGEQEHMARIVDADLAYLTELFDNDYNQLVKRYGSSREYRDKLATYKRQINPDYSTGALWKYKITINRDYSTSTHWKFDNEINPGYSTSTMWKYKNTTNPDYSTSTMWKYKNAVNPNYSTSLMWKLKNESNAHYSTSTMWSYKQGYLKLADARKKIDAILTNGSKDLQETRDQAVTSITKTRQDTVEQLFDLRDKTASAFLATRKDTLASILSIREQHFGSGLEVKPITISFDPIKVLINLKLMSFEQPPVIINGNTLVPMRAIFETLGASIEWDPEQFAVTATKGNQTIYLKIGEKKAQLNGKTIELGVPAQIVNANTMVPVRFISESLGGEVLWDNMTRTVVISR
ncbi:stalk domain-containing protein [Paenibacillus chungangensis]|uniref:Stalk domain-containing protein n=1 Tax=Paenibacillus chungangensis TaxID=696535 RepID=A0ABW3HR25_9BACL